MRYLVTAGPTHEPIDEVRYIANRSSGRMGSAIAHAAHAAGHPTTLLLGPVQPTESPAVRCLRFRTAAELGQLLAAEAPAADVVVMAAAVADFRPAAALHPGKIDRGPRWTLELEPVPDLIAEIASAKRPDQLVVGFALEEPARLAARARAKCAAKALDAIVANPLETMDADRIRGTLILADGSERAPAGGAVPKREFARWLVAELDSMLVARGPRKAGPDR